MRSIVMVLIACLLPALSQAAPPVAEEAQEGRHFDPGREGFVVLYAEGQAWVLSDARLINEIKRKLKARGYYSGKLDGKADPILHAALERFQGRSARARPGQLDEQTARRLGIDWNRLLEARRPLSAKSTREID